MEYNKLDSDQIYHSFISGAHEIIRKREEINRINVFPVADGDTGTNLALTLDSLVNNSRKHPSAGATLQSMSEAVLAGARGNSGIIFAEFIGGLAEALISVEKITVHAFSQALNNAVRKAYEALQHPVEGTILTVIKEWAKSIEEQKQLQNFSSLFQKTLKTAKRALEDTPNQLEVLKKAHVIDAGAAGFYHFLEGATKYLSLGETSVISAQAATLENELKGVHGGEYPTHRYCAEGLIRGTEIDTDDLRKILDPYGDSLIVAGGHSLARVHIHTDTPAAVFRKLSTFGAITEQKVDDMVREYEVTHDRKYKIALVTDSICDLPKELIDRYQIHVVPMNVSIGDTEYLDGVTITSDYIYSQVDTIDPYPTTSQPAPIVFRQLYSYLSTYYDSIIAIHVSSALSGTCGVSKREAERFGNQKITVIDSKQNSGSQALIVLRAAEAIAAGKNHEEVVLTTLESIQKAEILVSVPTLKYMVKGGRVTPFKGFLAGILNFRPIVSLDDEGKAVLYGKAFSKKQNYKKLIQLLGKELEKGKLKYYGLVHAENEDGAFSYAAEIEKKTGLQALFIQPISPIMGLNAGKGCVAVVTMRE